jgi:hypothetical protein
MRRGAASGMKMPRLQLFLLFFSSAVAVEKMHPLQCGVFRRKYRHDRRPGLPIEPVWRFYPQYLGEIVSKHVRILKRWLELELIRRRLRRDPQSTVYMDQSLTPVTDEGTETFAMFTHNEAARVEVARTRKHIVAHHIDLDVV